MAGLLDVKVERRVTSILIRWVYTGALVVVAFEVLFGLLWVWSLPSWTGWVMWLAASIVLGWRLVTLLASRPDRLRMSHVLVSAT